MAVEIKSKLAMKDLGSPKKAAGRFDDKLKTIRMGAIIGIATREIIKANPTGEPYRGLGGEFEAVPADGSTPVRSGILYFPPSLHEVIATKLNEVDEAGNQVVSQIQFAYDVSIREDGNPQGYTWVFTPKLAPAAGDPLAALKEQAKLEAPAPGPKLVADGGKPAAEDAGGKKVAGRK